MPDPSLRIVEVSSEDFAAHTAWCVSLMASSEPWITLGRDQAGCLASLARPGSELFVALDSSHQRLGFILVAPFGLAGSPYIAAIAVTATARGRGIGSQLLQFTETRFAARRHLFLLVSSFNSRAQQLYIRHGFRQVGEIPGYVAPTYSELIFYKALA